MKTLTKEILQNARPGIIEWWAKDEQTGAGWKGTIEFPPNYNGDFRITNRNGDFFNPTNYREIGYRDALIWFDPETDTKNPIHFGTVGSCPFNIYSIEYYPLDNIFDTPLKKELAVESIDVVKKWIEEKLPSNQLRDEPKIYKLF